MRVFSVIFAFWIVLSVQAGTFKDDFEDGNWTGWGMVPAIEERFSIV